MIVLGISVRFPNRKSLPPVLTMWAAFAFFSWLLLHFGLLDLPAAASLLVATCAGSLSSAMGVSVAEHGWRAIVIVVGLALVLWVPLRIFLGLLA